MLDAAPPGLLPLTTLAPPPSGTALPTEPPTELEGLKPPSGTAAPTAPPELDGRKPPSGTAAPRPPPLLLKLGVSAWTAGIPGLAAALTASLLPLSPAGNWSTGVSWAPISWPPNHGGDPVGKPNLYLGALKRNNLPVTLDRSGVISMVASLMSARLSARKVTTNTLWPSVTAACTLVCLLAYCCDSALTEPEPAKWAWTPPMDSELMISSIVPLGA